MPFPFEFAWSTSTADFLRPDSTVSAGSWETNTGATTNLHLTVDETTADDADFIRSEVGPSASVCQIGLSDPTNLNTSQDVILRYRYGKTGGSTLNMVVRLKEGVTTIASQAHNGVSAGFVDGAITLSAGEKSSVSNWNDVFFEVEATQV